MSFTVTPGQLKRMDLWPSSSSVVQAQWSQWRGRRQAQAKGGQQQLARAQQRSQSQLRTRADLGTTWPQARWGRQQLTVQARARRSRRWQLVTW